MNRTYIPYLVIFLALLQSCTAFREAKMLKQMDDKVPATSKWLGGVDGGVWVDIKAVSETSFNIFVFNDFTGEKINEFFYEHNCSSIDEKIIFNALNAYTGLELLWDTKNPITNCTRLIKQVP